METKDKRQQAVHNTAMDARRSSLTWIMGPSAWLLLDLNVSHVRGRVFKCRLDIRLGGSVRRGKDLELGQEVEHAVGLKLLS